MAFRTRGPKVPQTYGSLRNPGRPAQKPCFRNDGSIRRALRRVSGGSLSSKHEGWSATPSARPAGLDDVDGGPDGRVYIQMCRIEQVRVGCLFQGGDCAALVAVVPVPDIGEHLGLADGTPLRLVFGGATAGAHLGGGSHKDLHVGIRTDDGSDIAPIKHSSRRTGGKLTLERKQGLAHRAYR